MKSVSTNQGASHNVIKQRAVDQALVNANQGKFISATAMNDWIDSWGHNDELPMPEPDVEDGGLLQLLWPGVF